MDSDVVDSAITSTISRFVAALAPLIVSAVAAVTFWLQNAVGIDLQQYKGAAAAFIGTMLLGGFAMAWRWLKGRQEFERVVITGQNVYEAGQAAGRAEIKPPA